MMIPKKTVVALEPEVTPENEDDQPIDEADINLWVDNLSSSAIRKIAQAIKATTPDP